LPLALIIGTQLASKLVAKIGARVLLVAGPLLSAIGMLLLSRLRADSSYLTHLGLPGALTMLGIGLSFVPLTLAATNGVNRRDAGLASGLINTTRQIGGSLGLAALLTIAAARSNALAPAGTAAAQTGGYTRAFEISSGVLVVAALIAATVLPRLSKRAAAGTAAETEHSGNAVVEQDHVVAID
jgi:sugar phosphate permease